MVKSCLNCLQTTFYTSEITKKKTKFVLLKCHFFFIYVQLINGYNLLEFNSDYQIKEKKAFFSFLLYLFLKKCNVAIEKKIPHKENK